MQVGKREVGRRPIPPFADVNLCSGAGGLALGLTQAGFTAFDFFDKDRRACETLRHNLRENPSSLSGRVFEGDLSQIEWIRNTTDIRLLAAGAPCQPFSIGGDRKGHEDDRNLFPTILDTVRALRPRAILIENVRGLARGSHESYLAYILHQLSYPDLSPHIAEPWKEHDQRLRQHDADRHVLPEYKVAWAVFNAADFGVPQIRYRLFIVATAVGLPEYHFPAPTHSKQLLLNDQATGIYWESRGVLAPQGLERPSSLNKDDTILLPWVTVRDSISSLPPAHPVETDNCNNHWVIPGARLYTGHTGSNWDWPSKTLKAGVHGVPGGENMLVCADNLPRYYTLREMARLQSFLDPYYFVGARSNVIRQIGNATPCQLAAAVASPLHDLLEPQPHCETQHNLTQPRSPKLLSSIST